MLSEQVYAEAPQGMVDQRMPGDRAGGSCGGPLEALAQAALAVHDARPHDLDPAGTGEFASHTHHSAATTKASPWIAQPAIPAEHGHHSRG